MGEARVLSPNALCILYNLGICAEVTGDYQQALDLYKRQTDCAAARMKKYQHQSSGFQSLHRNREKLKEQMGK